jgi:uncharacterized membrane protein YfbV (UPF0208 family)
MICEWDWAIQNHGEGKGVASLQIPQQGIFWSEKTAVSELELPTRVVVYEHIVRQDASYEIGVTM